MFKKYVEKLFINPTETKICVVYGNQIGVDDFLVGRIETVLEEAKIDYSVQTFSNLSSYSISQSSSIIFVLSCTPFNESIRFYKYFIKKA